MSGDGARVAYPLFQEEDGGANPTSPLQFTIGVIGLDRAIELNKLWHSRLPIVRYSNMIRTRELVCYGAYFCNKIYAVAIWTNPIARAFNESPFLELRRLAISADAPKNTASRMIAVMTTLIRKTHPHITKLLSYQDTEVHTGTIYKACGWHIGRRTKASEVRWGKGGRKRNPVIASGDKIRWEKDL